LEARCNAQSVPPEFVAKRNEIGNRHPGRKVLPELASENEMAMGKLPVGSNKLGSPGQQNAMKEVRIEDDVPSGAG